MLTLHAFCVAVEALEWMDPIMVVVLGGPRIVGNVSVCEFRLHFKCSLPDLWVTLDTSMCLITKCRCRQVISYQCSDVSCSMSCEICELFHKPWIYRDGRGRYSL